jgi:hypothetical protein
MGCYLDVAGLLSLLDMKRPDEKQSARISQADGNLEVAADTK